MNLLIRTRDVPDIVPEGFKTAAQWCRELHISETHTGRILRKGIEKGIVVTETFKIETGRGVYPTTHYKELPDDTHGNTQTQQTSQGDRKHSDPTRGQHGKGQSRRQNAGRSAKARRRA